MQNVPDKKQPALHSSIASDGIHYGILKKNENSKSKVFKKIGRDVSITEVQNILETNEEKLKLSFVTDAVTGTRKEIEIQRSRLSKRHFPELLNYGIDAQYQNEDIFLMHMQNQEQIAPRVNVHFGLGFDRVVNPATGEKTMIFKGHKTIGAIDSTYIGPFNIEPHGDVNVWLKMVRNEVIGHTGLELGVVLGLAAIVKGFLRDYIGDESTLVHIKGESTTGKTTNGMLAVSVAGEPSKDGLFKTWNSTGNALEGILNRNFGFPLLFDEISTHVDGKGSKKVDFSPIIYIINGGLGKNRLNKDAILKEAYKWSTLVISTGEESPLAASSQNTGLRIRLLEFHVDKWTTDARHSNAIKNCVRNNYGFAAPMVAKYLLDTPSDALIAELEAYKQKYLGATTVRDEFTDRVAVNYALLLLTAEIVNEVLDINIDLDKMLDFFVENEKDNYEEKDVGKRAYSFFLQAVEMHPEKFGCEDKFVENMNDSYSNLKRPGYVSEDPRGEVWGKRVYLSESESKRHELAGRIYSDEKIIITQEKFFALLADGGFTNPKVILKKWKANGLLICESDRQASIESITQGGTPVTAYVVLVAKSEEEIEENRKKQNPKQKSAPKVIKPGQQRNKPIQVTQDNIQQIM